MRLTALIFIASGWLAFSSFQKPVQTTENPVYLVFHGGVLQKHDGVGGIRISHLQVDFDSGFFTGLKTLSRTEINQLFPDSTYPAPADCKNDTCAKTRLALPISHKRYVVRDVEVIGCGLPQMIIHDNKKRSYAMVSFTLGSKNRVGLVRIKGTNIYFQL